MIKAIRRFLGGTVDSHAAELHELTIRCARRCAYDFGHALDFIDMKPNDYRRPLVMEMQRRQQHWLALFKSGNSMKDYRSELQNEIWRQEQTINRLYKLLDDAGIADPRDQRLPF